ncbi:MAG: hypothetical protein CMM05_06445 [Rhodopirellula sp.]|nr:hypothetical protein [Rhodopirellula sp.]
MHSLFFLSQIVQSQLQTAMSFLIGFAFLASILVVGSIWILKRSPSIVSIVLYGVAFLLLCLPLLGLTTQSNRLTQKFKAIAVPFGITTVRATTGTPSVSIAPFGDIKKGDVLLQASSPEMDARLKVLAAQARKLEFDRRLVAESLALPGQEQLFGYERSEEQDFENQIEQRARQHRADIQSLERLRHPLLREISRLDIELQHANEDAEQFSSLFSRGLASTAEVNRKEKALEKVVGEMTSYKEHLQSIDDQIKSIKTELLAPMNVSTLKEAGYTIAGNEDKKTLTAKSNSTARAQMQEDLKATRIAQIDLQLGAIELEIDSVMSKQIHVAPNDGVVLWKHPSPYSTLPGTPLVAMSQPGQSGVLLKINGDDLEGLKFEPNSEILVDLTHRGFSTKDTSFQAKCVVHDSGSEQTDSGTCELLVISPLPATLVQSLLKSDAVPLEVSFKGAADSKTPWENLIDQVDIMGHYYDQVPTASK